MAKLDFPNSPVSGDRYTGENGITYVFDGIKWLIISSASAVQQTFLDGGSSTTIYDPLGLNIDGGSAATMTDSNDIEFDGGTA
jgi:hypothetical protein